MLEISASQLNTFLQCNRKWFWVYKEELKTTTSLGQLVGLVCHKLQEEFLKLKFVEKIAPPNSSDPAFGKFVTDFFNIQVRKGYRTTKKEYYHFRELVKDQVIIGNLTKKQMDKLIHEQLEKETLDLTMECAIAWRDTIFPNLNPYQHKDQEPPLGVEAWREMNIPKLDMKVRGIMDVIEGLEYLGSVPVYRDLKTLKQTPKTLADKEQYVFYSAIAHSKLKRFPLIVQDTILKLKRPKVLNLSSQTGVYEPLTITHNMEDLKVLFNRLKLFRDCVTDKCYKYPVAPHGSWYCNEDYCDFHGLCKSEKLIYNMG